MFWLRIDQLQDRIFVLELPTRRFEPFLNTKVHLPVSYFLPHSVLLGPKSPAVRGSGWRSAARRGAAAGSPWCLRSVCRV